MPRPRQKIDIGQHRNKTKQARLRRKNETPEEKAERVARYRLSRQKRIQNETVEQREQRLAKQREKYYVHYRVRRLGKKTTEKAEQRKRIIAVAAKKGKPEKKRGRPRKSDVLKKDFADIACTAPELVEVKWEPSIEMEEPGIFDVSVQEMIEFSDEIKQEYESGCLLLGDNPTSLVCKVPKVNKAPHQESEAPDAQEEVDNKPVVFCTTSPFTETVQSQQQATRTTPKVNKAPHQESEAPDAQEEVDNKPVIFCTTSPFTETVESQPQATATTGRFSHRRPLQTKDEVLKYVKLLEEFALQKEHFRLIGFTERLQHLIKKGR